MILQRGNRTLLVGSEQEAEIIKNHFGFKCTVKDKSDDELLDYLKKNNDKFYGVLRRGRIVYTFFFICCCCCCCCCCFLFFSILFLIVIALLLSHFSKTI